MLVAGGTDLRISRAADAPKAGATLTGKEALGDWSTDAPRDSPQDHRRRVGCPYDTPSAKNNPKVVDRPQGAWPEAPAGFEVTEFATGLTNPRVIARAPNGDLFVAESRANRVRLLRDADGDGEARAESGLCHWSGPPVWNCLLSPGAEPKYLYVGNTDAVVRFPYQNGDTKARGDAETIVKNIPSGNEQVGEGHWTRDLEFSPMARRCSSRWVHARM